MNAPIAYLARLAADLARAPDGQLLDAFLAGSQPAFRELVVRHGPLVYAACHRVLGHRQDAEDAFQAVFLVLARRAADVYPREAVGAWLYGVARRVALKARTLRTRRQVRQRPLEDVTAEPRPTPEPDTASVIARAVLSLPTVYRAAVVACDLEGLSRAEAAERLGWKEGTLSGRLARARQLLADRLRRAGLSVPAGGVAAALGAAGPVGAGLTNVTVDAASGIAPGGVSAPVAVLTEGVVPSMFAIKLKATAAALVVACGLGYGAWAAGAGGGDGPGVAPGTAGAPLAAAQPVPTEPRPAPAAARTDDDLKLLGGRWRIDKIIEDGKGAAVQGHVLEMRVSGNTLTFPFKDASAAPRTLEFKIAVDATTAPRSIDLIAPNQPIAKGIYEFTAPAASCTQCHDNPHPNLKPLNLKPAPDLIGVCGPGLKVSTGLRLAFAANGPRPTKFDSKATGVIEFSLTRFRAEPDAKAQLEREKARLAALLAAADGEKKAEVALLLSRLLRDEASVAVEEARGRLRAAEAETEKARVQVELANQQFTLASRDLQAAQAKLEALEKEIAAGGKAPDVKPGDTFTVHVRPLAAAEKVIRVKATGSETVLEGLAHAAEDMALKPDSLNVWLVRDKTVMPIDLAAITQQGVTTTNYVLKAGDKLFVQVKVGK